MNQQNVFGASVDFLQDWAAEDGRNMKEMWNALEQYQPYADKAGNGESWKRMTTERTVDAVELARDAERAAQAEILDEIRGSS